MPGYLGTSVSAILTILTLLVPVSTLPVLDLVSREEVTCIVEVRSTETFVPVLQFSYLG